jgi:CheY-like chemotaxis protein
VWLKYMPENASRLLLVDPNPVSRKLRARVLNERGYAVFPARSFDDAISRVKPDAYLAVLVSGDDEQEALDFCERLRSVHPKQLVIVLAQPESYIPEDACPDQVLEGATPMQVAKAVDQALRTA